jgi:hypothetical protein
MLFSSHMTFSGSTEPGNCASPSMIFSMRRRAWFLHEEGIRASTFSGTATARTLSRRDCNGVQTNSERDAPQDHGRLPSGREGRSHLHREQGRSDHAALHNQARKHSTTRSMGPAASSARRARLDLLRNQDVALVRPRRSSGAVEAGAGFPIGAARRPERPIAGPERPRVRRRSHKNVCSMRAIPRNIESPSTIQFT